MHNIVFCCCLIVLNRWPNWRKCPGPLFFRVKSIAPDKKDAHAGFIPHLVISFNFVSVFKMDVVGFLALVYIP